MVEKFEALKARLMAEREQIIAQLSTYDLEAQENPGYSNHMADDATDVFEQARSLALRQRLERSLQLVENALRKMEQGTYGLCEACGQPIDPARLKVMPSAELCMPCRRRVEHAMRT